MTIIKLNVTIIKLHITIMNLHIMIMRLHEITYSPSGGGAAGAAHRGYRDLPPPPKQYIYTYYTIHVKTIHCM